MATALDTAKYPLVTFAQSLRLAEAVRDGGGTNTDVPKSVIAHALQQAESSGGFGQRIMSARSFGMIEGRGSYRLTEAGRKYFYPENEAQKQQAALTFFASPSTFSDIIKRFDGGKVEAKMLANILRRELDISESWKDRVAGTFIKTAQAVGAMDASGYLRYRVAQHTMTNTLQSPSMSGQPAPAASTAPAPRTEQPEQSAPMSDCDTFVHSIGDQTVRLVATKGLSMALWKKLSSYVEHVLKPDISK